MEAVEAGDGWSKRTRRTVAVYAQSATPYAPHAALREITLHRQCRAEAGVSVCAEPCSVRKTR